MRRHASNSSGRARDRYDGFADTAELMGDLAGAERFRALANRRRLQAMTLLDD